MDNSAEAKDIIKKVKAVFAKSKIPVEKIFWDSRNGKVLVLTTPKNKVDGMYIMNNALDSYISFRPTGNPIQYARFVDNEDNLIYG